MRRYIKASYDKSTIINRLKAIPGVKLMMVDDVKVGFYDGDNNQYYIYYSDDTNKIDTIIQQVEDNAHEFYLESPENLSRTELENIVRAIIDATNTKSGWNCSSRVCEILSRYKLIRY